MADTIKIPGIGPLEKKYAIIGAAGVAGFVGYAYWRNRQAAADDTTVTDTTDTSGLDTATDAASDPYVYGSGDGGYSGGSPVYQSPINSFPTPPSGTTPTSDPEWYQNASNWLINAGVDSQAAGHALSLFLADLCMTQAEADYVRQAKGALGDPPQTHHNIQICTVTTPPPTTGGTATPPTGFHVQSTDKSGVSLAWTPVTGATRYIIHIGGGSLNHSIITGSSSYRFGALKKSTTYTFNIKSVVGGVESAASGNVSGKTKSK